MPGNAAVLGMGNEGRAVIFFLGAQTAGGADAAETSLAMKTQDCINGKQQNHGKEHEKQSKKPF